MSTRATGPLYETPTKGLVAMGTSAFAGVMLLTVGVFQILEGIAAIADDTVYVTGISYTYELDVTAWGWVHLVLGIVAVVVGAGILADQAWAVVLGIGIAVVAAMANFAFMPYYPFWSIVILAFNVLVIWALSRQLGPA